MWLYGDCDECLVLYIREHVIQAIVYSSQFCIDHRVRNAFRFWGEWPEFDPGVCKKEFLGAGFCYSFPSSRGRSWDNSLKSPAAVSFHFFHNSSIRRFFPSTRHAINLLKREFPPNNLYRFSLYVAGSKASPLQRRT